MGLEQIVNVAISRNTQSISQTGFGTPLVLGSNGVFTGVRAYSGMEGVSTDFASTTDEYKAAARLFAQSPRPKQVKIGKRLTGVSEVLTLTPTVLDSTVYTVTIAGVEYSYTSDADATATEIVTGLKTAINADAGVGFIATGVATLILTAKIPGIAATVTQTADLVRAETTGNVGVAESLAAISGVDNDWYALILCSKTEGDILAAASYIESVRKIFGVSLSDLNTLDAAVTTDLFSRLQAMSLFRTFTFWSADAANFPEAGMFGRFLPTVPGSEQWSFKTYASVTIDALSPTQINALKAKGVNFYTRIAGVNVGQEGKVAGGEWIDVIRFIDWVEARMQEEIFGSIVENEKIPYTNGGISIIENDVAGVLKAGQKAGGFAPDDVDPATGKPVPGYTTTFPRVSEISANDRASRKLTGGRFTGKLAGAIIAAEINGTVTV